MTQQINNTVDVDITMKKFIATYVKQPSFIDCLNCLNVMEDMVREGKAGDIDIDSVYTIRNFFDVNVMFDLVETCDNLLNAWRKASEKEIAMMLAA